MNERSAHSCMRSYDCDGTSVGNLRREMGSADGMFKYWLQYLILQLLRFIVIPGERSEGREPRGLDTAPSPLGSLPLALRARPGMTRKTKELIQPQRHPLQ